MHTNIICRVDKYDQNKGVGDLEPLFLDDEGNPLPMIVNARAVKSSRNASPPSYERGDIVLVCVLERDLSDAVRGRKGNGDSTEPFSLSSAVIVGVIT